MAQLWRIILWVLWRHRPAAAVEASLCDIIQRGLAFFANPEACQELQDNRYACAIFSAGLLDAHSKLDFLIHLRALEIAGLAWRGPDWRPCKSPHHSDRTAEACWRRFRQLVTRFEQVERLAQLRAVRLTRESEACPLRLRTACASTSPVLYTEEESRQRLFDIQISSSSAQRWGRWIARACAQDGGGSHARGPPPTSFPKIRNIHLSRHATEIAPSCPSRTQHSEISVTFCARRCAPQKTGVRAQPMTTRANLLRLKRANTWLAPARRD